MGKKPPTKTSTKGTKSLYKRGETFIEEGEAFIGEEERKAKKRKGEKIEREARMVVGWGGRRATA